MIGDGYWSTGITVRYRENADGQPGWAATARYLDDGFCDDDPGAGIVSTEGTLHTRYFVKGAPSGTCLAAAVDALVRDAERLGITWKEGSPVWYDESGDWPPPDGWREMMNAQARRLGWRTAYSRAAQ